MTERPPVQPPVARTCVTCAHYRQASAISFRTCARDLFADPVTGSVEESRWSCTAERASTTWHKGYTSTDPCGPEGKHWIVRRADQEFMDRLQAGDPEAVALTKRPSWPRRALNAMGRGLSRFCDAMASLPAFFHGI